MVPIRCRSHPDRRSSRKRIQEGPSIRRDLLPLVRQALGDRYSVEREIGHGGAARIFLAHNAAGDAVALKVLRPELQVSVAADRFLREVRFASQMDHPLIPKVLDSGERDWIVYYVMPYIEGPTLRAALDRGRELSIDDTLRVGCDLLDALGCAHQHGVIHRDVKPENIVISREGAILLDFGIARAMEMAGSEKLTRTGMTVGTSGYMSPEQISAESGIDHRADLYAVGSILFECLAGRQPFVHRNEAVVLQMHLTEAAPDVRHPRPDAPPPLAEAIARALRKSPADRWQSAAEMLAALGVTECRAGAGKPYSLPT